VTARVPFLLALAAGLGAVGSPSACVRSKDPAGLVDGSAPPVAAPSASVAASLPPPSDAPGLCATICARSAPLHCPESASCVPRCAAMRGMPVCQDAVKGALDCFAAAPTSAWTCNDHGLPSIRAGMCEAEQSRAAKCLSEHPPKAPR
jgi:hypothetical protein